MDIEKRENADFSFHGGLEYKPYPYFSLRGGIDHTVPTAGFGLSSGNYFLDYSITSTSAYSADYSHQLSAGIRFGSFDMGIKVTPKIFSPAGRQKTVDIVFIGSTRYGTKTWRIVIRDEKGNIVKKLEGKNNPPESFVWDGKLENGDLVKNGEYEIELMLVDKVNETQLVTNKVTVDTGTATPDAELEIQ